MPSPASSHTESLSVRLGSPDSQVNAAAVASTMQAILAIVDEAQKGLKANEHVLLKARPFANGSFEIPLDLIVLGAAALFDVHPLLDQVLGILKDYIDIKKLLKGEPLPQPTDNGTIVVQGNTITVSNSVINVLSSNRVNSAVDRAVTDIAADETIRDVKVFRGRSPEPFITIPNTEFQYLRYTPRTSGEMPDRDRVVKATLTLRTLVFEGTGKWRFNYEGVKISADIRDDDFKRRVAAGVEQFAAGDRLEVELIIAERYNPTIADYERKGQYSIARVFRHIKQPSGGGASQTSFLDDDEDESENA